MLQDLLLNIIKLVTDFVIYTTEVLMASNLILLFVLIWGQESELGQKGK